MESNHFDTLGLPVHFAVDSAALEDQYRRVQGQLHPDRHASQGSAALLASTQRTMRLNEAYAVLREPASRARYLLQLRGADPLAPGGGDLPPEFLMAQLEWREAMEQARSCGSGGALQDIDRKLALECHGYADQLARLIDRDGNYADAAAVSRRLSFVAKVRRDLAALIDELDA